MIHYCHLKPRPFNMIKKGCKKIEMRLYDEKRQQFKVGDVLIFDNVENKNETLTTKIINLHLFKNFKELYQHFNKTDLGYTEFEESNYTDMEEYYPYEMQSKYGVVGIEIELIK